VAVDDRRAMRISIAAALGLMALNLAACASDAQLAANIARGGDASGPRAWQGQFRPPAATPGLSCQMQIESPCIR
jgi:hypothetical protein